MGLYAVATGAVVTKALFFPAALLNHASYKEFRWRFSLNMSLSVIMADIDHFKRYNDAYGHQSGDRLLAGAAGILMKSVRDSDLVTRYGGGGYYCEILTRRF